MSRSIDLFIDCTREPEEVAQEIGRLSGFELAEGEGPGSFALDDGDVHAVLRAHAYLDDGDLPLSRYRYTLSSRVADDVRLADAPETRLLRMVSETLQKVGIPTLLVHDLQYRDPARHRPFSEPGGQDPRRALDGGPGPCPGEPAGPAAEPAS